MKPEAVELWADILKRALEAENEQMALDAARALLVGAALNLALLAHPTGEPL